MTDITVDFVFERSTKGTHRFKEVGPNDSPMEYAEQVVGTLYVKKAFFEVQDGAVPKRLNVTISPSY